jgi:LPXTG-site transpeptidase (sortase) family protein
MKRHVIIANITFLLLAVGSGYLIALRERDIRPAVSVPVLDVPFDGQEATSTPVLIEVPELGVSAAVVPVGRAASGNMAVPDSFVDTGWYRLGAVPGARGNAVIAGHLDDGRGNEAVFAPLRNARVGDRVYVTNSAGERIPFSVREIRLVRYDDPPLQEIFGATDKYRLNLITCDGTWDSVRKTYDERLVVFTERIVESNQ